MNIYLLKTFINKIRLLLQLPIINYTTYLLRRNNKKTKIKELYSKVKDTFFLEGVCK